MSVHTDEWKSEYSNGSPQLRMNFCPLLPGRPGRWAGDEGKCILETQQYLVQWTRSAPHPPTPSPRKRGEGENGFSLRVQTWIFIIFIRPERGQTNQTRLIKLAV